MYFGNDVVDWRRAAWTASFTEAEACQRLDEELEKLCWNLRRHAPSLERTLRSRVLRWVSKFESERDSPALVWKKGRNAHARALLAGLRRGRLPAPFDAGPPAGEPLGAPLPVSCAAAVGLSASGDWVRGRRSLGEGEAFSAKRRQSAQAASESEASRSGKEGGRSRKRPVVPGTALPLAPPLPEAARGTAAKTNAEERRGEETGAAAAPSASADPFYGLHVPSRVELAASLGAAAERIAELEWRLGEKERRARAREWESRVAAARAAAMLSCTASSSPFDEWEEEGKDEGVASPPRRSHGADDAFTPLPPIREARWCSGDSSESRRRAERGAPFFAPSPKAATTAPLLQKRPKLAATPQQPLTTKRKLKLAEKHEQKQKIPAVSLEEISRRIAALAPQQQQQQRV